MPIESRPEAAIAFAAELAYRGVIASIPAANQFIVTAFIGLGAGKFADALPWQVYVLQDAAGGGAAPQGELQPVTAFNSVTGQVNHSAFTVALVATDEIILLHPSVAHIDFSTTEKAAINTEADNALNTAIPGGPTADSINERIKTLDDAYTAARAGYLDELAAANLPTDVGTLLTRLSAVRAGYLDELDFDLQALLNTIAGYIDAEITAMATSQGRMLFTLDFKSAGKVQVQITAAGVTITLPTITVAGLPAGATVQRVEVWFKFRMIENTYAGVNKLNGATVANTSQVIQIQDDGGGSWIDAILFVDDFFTLADTVREGGDVIFGAANVGGSGYVDGNDTYNLRFLLGKADQDFITFDDVQVGLRITYSV